MSGTLELTADLIQDLSDSSRQHQEWLDRGLELARVDTDRQFDIGDWLTEGEECWTRKVYTEAATIFIGYQKETLYVFASVSRSVEILTRIKDLSWAHHRAIMRFGTETQQRLLNYAKEHQLSLRDFLLYIKDKHPPIAPVGHADDWKNEWKGMPEYDQPELPPFKTIKVHFERQEDVDRFADIIGQTITPNKKYIWFPKKEQERWSDKQYVHADNEGTREGAE